MCFWCSQAVAENDVIVECYFCTHKFHAVTCGNIPKEVCETMKTVNNIKFFCDRCLGSNLTTTVGKQFDKLTSSVDEAVKKVNCYDELVKKIDSLTTEFAAIKNVVNTGNSSSLIGTPIKRLRAGSLKRSSFSLSNDETDEIVQIQKKKREDKSIEGTSNDVVSNIKIVEGSEWFHVSRFDPSVETEDMKKWFVSILADNNISCLKLLPRNRSEEELTFVSFKLGVPKSLTDKVMNPTIWPKNVTVKPFENRSYSSKKNYRPPHPHRS